MMHKLLKDYRPQSLDEHWLLQAFLAPIPVEGEGVLLQLNPEGRHS